MIASINKLITESCNHEDIIVNQQPRNNCVGNAKKHELITTIPTVRQNEWQQPHSPVSKLENGKNLC